VPSKDGGAGTAETAPPAAPKPSTAAKSPGAKRPAGSAKHESTGKSQSSGATKPAAKRVSAERPKAAAQPAKHAARSPEKPDRELRAIPSNATLIDATGLVLGRAASLIAKRLLGGETVVVVNAEKSVVTGARAMVVREYTAARAQGSVRSGPHFPRYPDRIFRRTVRGMLPHLKTRGKVAFHRLHVFIGVPAGLGGRAPISLDLAKARPALRPPTSLADITRLLGARLW
jgi:large subunit ribosomal protein L13